MIQSFGGIFELFDSQSFIERIIHFLIHDHRLVLNIPEILIKLTLHQRKFLCAVKQIFICGSFIFVADFYSDVLVF